MKICKYCEIVSFFGDTAQAILNGPQGFDHNKFHFDYKPNGIEALINGAIKPSDLEMLFGDTSNSTRSPHQECLLEGELNGFNLDIDGLYTTLVSSRKKDIQMSKVQVEYKDIATHSKEMIQKYASLREKYTKQGASLADVKETDERESQPSSNRNLRNNNSKSYLDTKRVSDPNQRSEAKLNSQPNESRKNIVIQTKKNEVLTISLPNQTPKSFVVNTLPDYQAFLPTKTASKFMRPSTQQGGAEYRPNGKRGSSKQFLDPLRTDGFRAIKTANGRSEDLGLNSLQQIKDANVSVTSKQVNSKQALDHRRFFRETAKPEIITLATEYYNDGMTTEDAQMLNILYPLTCVNRIQTEMDKEARKHDFAIPNIKA
ncbi:MAG: hypothetical protein EOP48_27255, partial [Sphingobacteriales bacterium]